jgi:HK97 family phage portal protein
MPIFDDTPFGLGQVMYSTYGAPDQEPVLPTFLSYSTQAYSGNAVVFGLIRARMALFTEATLKWQNLTTKKLYGDGGLSLLEEPWENGTTGDLLARMELDASLAGNAFIRRVSPTQLERLRPDYMTVITKVVKDQDGKDVRQLAGYAYNPTGWDSDRLPEVYDPDEICHWAPIPDPLATFRGMSWLTPIVREINSDQGMTAYKTQYLTNAATPNLVITYDRELTDEAAKKVGAAVQARHGGVDNAFKTMILDKGATMNVVGADMKSMNFTDVQSAGEARIAMAAGVPPIVAGLAAGLDAATYSNYAMAMRAFADLWARPSWRSACAALAMLVEVPTGSRLWYDTTDIAALLEGEQERANTFQTKSISAKTLIDAGYEPTTVAAAIDSGDMTQLKHTGRIPTQLYNTDDPVGPAYKPKETIQQPPVEGPDAPGVKSAPVPTTVATAPKPKPPPAKAAP